MGMWQGLYLGMQNVRERREREQEREDLLAQRERDEAFRREELELRRQAFQQTAERDRIAAITAALPDLQAASARSAALADRGSRLRGYFPDNPIVDTILSTGNVEAIDRVLGNIGSRYEEAERQREGGGQEFLDQWLSMAESDYTFTPATAIDYDLSRLNITPEEFAAMGFDTQFTQPGDIVGRPAYGRDFGGLEDYERAEERIATAALDAGNLEMQRIAAGLARINETLETTRDPNQRSQLEQARDVLVERRQEVEGALDMAEGDNASFAGVLRLYGNQAAANILSGATVELDPSMLSPAFTENMSGSPISVVSEDQALLFMELGIIQPGDTIILDGRRTIVD